MDVVRGNARASAEALGLDARRAALALGLAPADLREVLDVDAATAVSIHTGEARLALGSETAERTLRLVRLHRALGDVYGSIEQANRWLDGAEPAFNGAKPRDVMRTPAGLQRVAAHVERRCKDCLW